jgi:hypothetical protein
MSILEYKIILVPESILIINGLLASSDQEIVNKLKVDNLFIKIINFYTQLKMANQRVSEGKDTCPVYINWAVQGGVKVAPVTCLQSRYLLSVLNVNNPFGRIVELSARYLQDLKYHNNLSRNGLIYNKQF